MATWSCGLQLRIVEGPGKGRTLPFDSPEVSIGRSRNPADRAPGWVLLNDDSVSRIHAELSFDAEAMSFVLRHRSTTNLTFVNERSVEEILLQVGDRIKLGSSVLELQQADMRFSGEPDPSLRAPAASRPPKSVIPASRTPEMEMEKPVSTKKAARVAALTQRSEWQLEVVEGAEKRKTYPISGLTITLGGASEEAAADPKKDGGAWYDQSVELKDANFPRQCVALSWKELQNGFSLWRPPHSTAKIKVTRVMDGTDWVATLQDTPILVKANDLLTVGMTTLKLVQP